jgi:hypothetical protein
LISSRLAAGARALLLGGWLAAGGAAAQDYGDTPYVQTPQVVVDKMLEIARVGADDYVIDLGSGDGRMVISAASRFGARGFGVDLDARLVKLSNANAVKAGVADRAAFHQRDLHETDVRQATVLTLYLLPEVNLMIRARLLATLRPGTRIVSHDYDMGEWPPDFQTEIDAPGKKVGISERSRIFYWSVPGRAAGRWHSITPLGEVPGPFELVLEQTFQTIEGRLEAGGLSVPVTAARLDGNHIRFTARVGGAQHEFSGRIVHHAIEGTVRVSRNAETTQAPWHAARTELWEPRHLVEGPAGDAR